MEVGPASRKYLIIATHLGYFQIKKLTFGVSFAPAIFQKAMDKILLGIPKTSAYIDDILVAGTSQEEHLKLLEEVLESLKQANIRIKKSSVNLCKRKLLTWVIELIKMAFTQPKSMCWSLSRCQHHPM